MAANNDSQSGRGSFELLAISFAYPPLAYPRSGQVARLLKHMRAKTTLVCADEAGARRDPTLEPEAEASLRACVRVPFALDGWRDKANRAAVRLRLPLWGKTPDQYASWKPAVLKAVRERIDAQADAPDALVTFGQPMSDHLIGLELKRRYGWPWAAHFSDPWVDNPFHRYDALTRARNFSLERSVMEAADRLVFTSAETIAMVMAKYPAEWKEKTRVLPQSFDPALYPARAVESRQALTVRYTGEFYGRRTPKPLIATLRALLSTQPAIVQDVRFELIGPVDPLTLVDSGMENLPEELLVIRPPVNFQESLALTASADGLMIIDAPAQQSVFLPSKLIDYIGAGRPIIGLTPPGAAAALIKQLGGWIADPLDVEAMTQAMTAFLSSLRHNQQTNSQTWGEPTVRQNYEATVVANSFELMLQEMLAS
jgi:glycosyltransferase involved in cell wall biosynthesis